MSSSYRPQPIEKSCVLYECKEVEGEFLIASANAAPKSQGHCISRDESIFAERQTQIPISNPNAAVDPSATKVSMLADRLRNWFHAPR